MKDSLAAMPDLTLYPVAVLTRDELEAWGLRPREAAILHRRYGDVQPVYLRILAVEWGVTTERARQIEWQGLVRLRRRARRWRAVVEWRLGLMPRLYAAVFKRAALVGVEVG